MGGANRASGRATPWMFWQCRILNSRSSIRSQKATSSLFSGTQKGQGPVQVRVELVGVRDERIVCGVRLTPVAIRFRQRRPHVQVGPVQDEQLLRADGLRDHDVALARPLGRPAERVVNGQLVVPEDGLDGPRFLPTWMASPAQKSRWKRVPWPLTTLMRSLTSTVPGPLNGGNTVMSGARGITLNGAFCALTVNGCSTTNCSESASTSTTTRNWPAVQMRSPGRTWRSSAVPIPRATLKFRTRLSVPVPGSSPGQGLGQGLAPVALLQPLGVLDVGVRSGRVFVRHDQVDAGGSSSCADTQSPAVLRRQEKAATWSACRDRPN
jgi:hypothetical protein